MFDKLLKEIGIELTELQEKQFEDYYNFLVEKNKVMNLTGIVERDMVYLKHFYDSILLIKGHDFSSGNIKICDVGAGAGFPSIPLKIVYPNIEVTIVDSLNKRINFLKELTKILYLENVRAVHQRAEEFAVKNRESFDIVTARAVARLNVLSELCIPLVKPGGYFLALKGEADEELNESSETFRILSSEIDEVITYKLPIEESDRCIVKVKKIGKTSLKYPRSFGIIKKTPL